MFFNKTIFNIKSDAVFNNWNVTDPLDASFKNTQKIRFGAIYPSVAVTLKILGHSDNIEDHSDRDFIVHVY